jgi:hypothetical protein
MQQLAFLRAHPERSALIDKRSTNDGHDAQ